MCERCEENKRKHPGARAVDAHQYRSNVVMHLATATMQAFDMVDAAPHEAFSVGTTIVTETMGRVAYMNGEHAWPIVSDLVAHLVQLADAVRGASTSAELEQRLKAYTAKKNHELAMVKLAEQRPASSPN